MATEFPRVSVLLVLADSGDGALDAAAAATLRAAHHALAARGLACTLDERPRVAPRDAVLSAHAAAVLRVAADCGYHFTLAPAGI